MKIVNYQFPKSSFLSIEKDLDILVNPISKKIYNENSIIKKSNEKYIVDLH